MSVALQPANYIPGPPLWFGPVDNPNNPGISVQSGTLVIQGSHSDDTAVVKYVAPSKWTFAKPTLDVTLTTATAASQSGWADINTPLYSPNTKTTYHQSYDPTQLTQVVFFGDAGNDSFTNNSSIPCSAYGTGSDNFVGGSGGSYFKGGVGTNTFESVGGNTTIVAGTGDNQFVFAAGDTGWVTINNLANSGQNTLDFTKFGPSGITVDLGSSAKQTVHSTNGVADLQLTLTNTGFVGNVVGSPFADVIKGAPGNNVIEGGGGNDNLVAGPGNNRFVFSNSDLGSVTIGGNTAGHYNILDFSKFGPSGITLNLGAPGLQTVHSTNGVADLQLTLAYSGGMQDVQGTPYVDVIHADNYGDVIHGNGGNDTITGGTGGDHLYADSGNCSLYSGGGAPSFLYGGMGASFLCTVGGSGQDTVTSGSGLYNPWGGDSLWVETTDTLHYNSVLDTRHHVHKISQFFNNPVNGILFGAPSLARNSPFLLNPLSPFGNSVNVNGDPLFATGGPFKDDVVQGGAGDCYLMSFLAGLAKVDPGRVRQYVADLGDGTYVVDFQNELQQDVFIRVNSLLPSPDGTNLAYAGFGKQNSIWVPLIEKAWAYYRTDFGSYASIDYSPVGEGVELGQAFGVTAQLTVHDPNLDPILDGVNYLNAIRDAWLAGKAAVITGPYDNQANPFTDQSGTVLHESRQRAHAYLVDNITLDGNNNVVTVTIRDPYAKSGNGKGYATLSGQTVAYCSNELDVYTPA
jgi:Ca2+-binding RTX toxin-like protein